jgi:hypothetical protein
MSNIASCYNGNGKVTYRINHFGNSDNNSNSRLLKIRANSTAPPKDNNDEIPGK